MIEIKVEDHSFFVVRAATNPISDLIDSFNQARINPTHTYLAILEGWIKQPWNQQGLLLASPDLYDAWRMQSSSLKSTSSTFKALWRYMLRSYSRATPFGLYAGAGVGRIGNQTVVHFSHEPWQSVSRPDAKLLNGLTNRLLQDQSVRKQLNYSLNNSLYQIGQEFRFSQSFPQATGFKIILTSYDASEELSLIVRQLTQCNTLTYQELLALFTQEEQPLAELYIDQLIKSQFLSSSLLLPVTGQDWISQLTSLTQSLQFSTPLLLDIISIVNNLGKPDQSINSLLNSQLKLKQIYKEINDDPSDYIGSMIQTDLVFSPNQVLLKRELVHDIAQQFVRILPSLYLKNDFPITSFIRRFRDRYQDEAIDLLTVLDPEYGIGLNEQKDEETQLLRQIPFSTLVEKSPEVPSLLVRSIYERFSLTGEMDIAITEEDLQQQHNKPQNYQLPVSSYLFGELYQQATSKNGSGSSPTSQGKSPKWYFSLKAGTTSSSAFLLGRFCINDPILTSFVQEMCAWEQKQYPNDILAEVVHAPPTPKQARNVVSRPVLRLFEIPYLTSAGTSTDKVINLADLCIRVTKAEQIQLFLKQTGRRIRPRLSTAHKITLGDDIYQFLGYVEQMETNRYGWQWGYYQDQPILPRITYQNLILQPARWTIRKESLHLVGPDVIQQIIYLYKLPRFVQFIEMDLSLMLDLEAAPCRTIFLDELEKNDVIRLKEWLPASYQPWLINEDKTYISELIIPLKGPSPLINNQSHSLLKTSPFSPTHPTRNIYPGGEWLYYKVYLNDLAADQFLIKNLFNFISQLLAVGWCQQFFFIRYADPDFHLRIRVLANPSFISNLIDTCNSFFTPSVSNLLVHRFSIETYQRELERYSPLLMTACERIFSQDSLMILTYLSSENELLKTDVDRYSFAVGSVDNLLDDLHVPIEEKIKFCQQNQVSYLEEEGSLKAVKKSLNELYRQYANPIFEQSQQYVSYFQKRSLKLCSEIDLIYKYYQENGGTASIASLLASIIHVHVNRLFSVQQRRHELVIYHFLVRRYESRLARSKK